jgi:predicted kinase
MSKLILMMGVAGAGKSTWIRENTCKADAIVSRDKIRFEELDEKGGDYFAHEDEVFRRFIAQIIGGLVAGETVYADATHLNRKARTKVLSKVRKYASEIEVVWIKVPLETAIKQNELRSGRAKVPVEAIKNMYRSIERPDDTEGINKLTIVEGGEEKVWYM